MTTINTTYGKVKVEAIGKREVAFGAYVRTINVYKDVDGRMFGRIAYGMREIINNNGILEADTEKEYWVG